MGDGIVGERPAVLTSTSQEVGKSRQMIIQGLATHALLEIYAIDPKLYVYEKRLLIHKSEADSRKKYSHTICLPVGTYSLMILASTVPRPNSMISIDSFIIGDYCTYNITVIGNSFK